MELSCFTEGKETHPSPPPITNVPPLMLKGNTAEKDGSVVLQSFFFMFLDLVSEEPTKTAIVCVDFYSLELATFLLLTLRHET